MTLGDTAQTQLDAFLAYLKNERNLAQLTRQNYERQLLKVQADLALSSWTDLTTENVQSALNHARRQQLSPRSIALRLSALRSLCQFLVLRGALESNPASVVNAPKQARPLPKHLNVDQINALLDIKPDTLLATRDRAIFELIYGCGLRLAEVASLDQHDVGRDGQVRVTGKGSKERQVPLAKAAREALAQWRKVRGQLAPLDESALFVSKQKRRLSTRQIAKRLSLWAKRQGLDLTVSPHKLRHSYATHMLESSGDLRAVQELLGHANLSTTQVYTHLDFQHLAKVYDAAHPRARKTK